MRVCVFLPVAMHIQMSVHTHSNLDLSQFEVLQRGFVNVKVSV